MRAFASDAETFGALDLKLFGSYLYARHPSTDVRCVSYCLIEDNIRGPVKTWFPGDPPPPELVAIEHDNEALSYTYNDAFDRQIHQEILARRYGWPWIPLERRRCIQAATLVRALPASLDAAAAALGLTTRKSPKAVALMKRLAKPRRQSAKERKAGKPLDFSATPEEIVEHAEYNRCDVMMMLDVADRIGLLSAEEQATWELDQVINARGVQVDIMLLEAALLLEQEAKREVRAGIAELTNGVVTTAAQRDRMLAWLAERGCKISNLRKATVAEALLEPKLTASVRRLLELRQQGAGTAALKFATLRRWTAEQGEPRIRFAYRYHGASSGRFTSLGCQLHNLRKPELVDLSGAIAAVKAGSLSELRRRGFERPLDALGQIARAVPIAALMHRLFIADLSGIESRAAASIVGDMRTLEQWRTFDRSGRAEDDLYFITGTTTFHQPPETARKAGKTGELAFQYQGGVGAYRRITGDNTTSDEIIASRRDAWRYDHREHTQFWGLAIFQAVQAIQNPGQDFSARCVNFRFDPETKFLELTLPSKRKLFYPRAELIEDAEYGSVSFTFLDASGGGAGRMYHERRGGGAFGGLLLENITQAFCRDIFVAGMLRLEAAGYAVVMHTHDEYVCEVPDGFGSLEQFLTLITTPPEWAPGLPIAAKARISNRLIEIVEPKQAATVITDNIVANAIADLEEEDESDVEDDAPEQTPALEPSEPAPQPLLHACTHCHRDPDGSEQPSAYNDAWLHPGCVDAFIDTRMAEEGILRSESAEPKPEPRQPSDGNGSDGFEGFNVATFLHPHVATPKAPTPFTASAQDGNGYAHGEHAAGPTTAEYIYKDARGRLYMRVARTAGHTFPTFHWSDGQWASGWPKEVVPYRLPELLVAPADELVLICEGEKDVDSAARYGFVATTNPGGAEKWQPELAQYFQGKQRVVIVEDHDTAGERNTTTIIAALRDIVPTIGVVRFPELGPGGDLSDFFAAGGTKAYLLTRIETALKAGTAAPYVLINLHNVSLKAQAWLWRGHYPIGALELTTGVVGLGKGLLQCDIIARITTGANWPDGSSGPIPGRVMVLTAEDRKEDYRRRCQAAGADLRKIEILDCVRRNERDELFLLGQDLDKLELACRQLGDVSLVNIDPITAFMGSGRGFDSHRATDVRSQLHPLAKLAERLNIAFGAVTHPPKGAASRAALDSFIGSQAFIAAARVGHYCIAELGPEDDRGFRRPTGRILFTTPKASHSAQPLTLAFRREVVRIGYDAQAGEWIEAPRIVWDPQPLDLTADEAIASNREARGDGRKMRLAPVREFLRDLLANGPMLVKTITERGAALGFKLSQLRRARQDIGAKAFKRQGGNLDSPWMWAMPEHVPPGSVEQNDEN
jgi:DNA polymerase bacteriophage-type